MTGSWREPSDCQTGRIDNAAGWRNEATEMEETEGETGKTDLRVTLHAAGGIAALSGMTVRMACSNTSAEGAFEP